MSMMVESLLMAVLIQVASYVAVRQLSVTSLLLSVEHRIIFHFKVKTISTKISK